MPDVTVHRHGDRWTVAESGAPSPLQEFATRAAAESAARQLAAGGAVEVLDEDPTSLAAEGETPDPEPEDAPHAPADGVRDPERVREEQGGL